MYKLACILTTALLTSVSFADEKVIEKNIGGSEPVELESVFQYPQIPGLRYSKNDLNKVITLFKTNKGSLSHHLEVSASKKAIEDLLHKVGLPAQESSREVTENRVVEKERCEVKTFKKTISFQLIAEDEFFLSSLGGKCKRAIGKPEKLAKLRAKGLCLPYNYLSIQKSARLVELRPLKEELVSAEVLPNTQSYYCRNNIEADPGLLDAENCSKDVSSSACLRVTKQAAPTLVNRKWVYNVSLNQNLTYKKMIENLVVQETKTVTTKLQELRFILSDSLYAGKGDKGKIFLYPSEEGWSNYAFLGSFLSEKGKYNSLQLVGEYVSSNGKKEELSADYPDELTMSSLRLENIKLDLALKRRNIIKLQYHVERVSFNENDFYQACKQSWSFGDNNRAKVFPIFCRGDVDQMSLKYRVRLYFKDSKGQTRYVTMMTQSALEGFKLENRYLYIPGADETTPSEAERFMAAQYADQLVDALFDPDSVDSSAGFVFPMTAHNVVMGVKGDKDDVYLGLSNAVKAWKPNAVTWELR